MVADRVAGRWLAQYAAADADGVLRSPAVGFWRPTVRAGQLVGPDAALGWLVQLGRRQLVLAPKDCPPAQVLPADMPSAVGYGDRLLCVAPLHATSQTARWRHNPSVEEASVEEASREDASQRAGLRSGASWAVRAPTAGRFYLRPNPDAQPFVQVGDRVQAGQAIGLLEVMKTFTSVTCDLPGMPPTLVVASLCVADGADVDAGTPLVLLTA